VEIAAKLLLIALVPSAVAGAVFWLPRAVRAARARRGDRHGPRPGGPPLERTAADLRRLMAEHAQVRRSPGVAGRGRRLAALEAALSDCALEAARALDVAPDSHGQRRPLSRAELGALLRELAECGVVLPDAERFGR
jgi:hypothetical protein